LKWGKYWSGKNQCKKTSDAMASKEKRLKLAPESQLRLHLREPDYSRPLLVIADEDKHRIMEKLALLYGEARAPRCFGELERIMRVYYAHKTPEMIAEDKDFDSSERFTERDIILITYGDVIRREGESPLRTLVDCLKHYAQLK
jgi:sucrose phosphorylase